MKTFNFNGTEILNKNQLCTAWVNFDGTDGTIRDSYNVSSVVRNAAGDYVIHFAQDMDNTAYSVVSGNSSNDDRNSNDREFNKIHTRTTKNTGVLAIGDGGTVTDCPSVFVQVFGGKN